VHCAVGLPNLGDYGDPVLLVELARRAEDAGWEGVFLWDHIVYNEPGWPAADPWVAAGAIAASTERVRLGVLITPLARRRPWKVARETASLDVLSGGRLVVGAGLGGLGARGHAEFAAFGDEADPRVRAELLDEGLDILTGLWSGEPFSFEGRHHRIEETIFLPRPLQRPRPPVWIAGKWPRRPGFIRAARWDGVFPVFEGVGGSEMAPPEALAEAVRYTEKHRDTDGPFDVALEGLSEGPDPELIAAYEAVGLTWWIEKLGWFRGSVDAMRERIERGPPVRSSA
jgi:alkanesulfonate monooxygenase SsuD/methylene tetrahydromethanopterin reductase-like flavin-dependent oxidoreductase (luciferase family)